MSSLIKEEECKAVPFLEKHERDVEPRFQPHHVEVTAELHTVLLKDVVTQHKLYYFGLKSLVC
jgi:hypothetical protein